VEIKGTPQVERLTRVPCGVGNQRVSWLALVVAQRVSNRLPRGMRRSYEHEHSGIRGGLILPGEISNSVGQTIDPHLLISQAFKDGDTCYMRLGASFSGDGAARAKTLAHGIPSNYVSPFNQRAYYPTMASSINSSAAMQQRAVDISKREGQTVSMCERVLEKRRGHGVDNEEAVLAAKFRLLMCESNIEFSQVYIDVDGDGVNDAEQTKAQEALRMFELLVVHDLEQEKDAMVLLLEKYLNDIVDVFQYFAAYGSETTAIDVSTISRPEFFHFLRHCNVFDLDNDGKTRLEADQIFDHSTR
jgi:hypothetical protein